MPFYKGDMGQRALLACILKEHEFESSPTEAKATNVHIPAKYFQTNLEHGIVFMGGLLQAGVRRVVAWASSYPVDTSFLIFVAK